MRKLLLIILVTLIIVLVLDLTISDKDNLYTSIGGTLIGFLGSSNIKNLFLK